MKTNSIAPEYKGFRFPPEIISHAMWLSFRFPLSLRDVEERTTRSAGSSSPMKQSGNGGQKFGQISANKLRHRRPQCGDTWHMDEVFLTIRGEKHYLWRAVNQDGNILDIRVPSRRHKQAAKRFFANIVPFYRTDSSHGMR